MWTSTNSEPVTHKTPDIRIDAGIQFSRLAEHLFLLSQQVTILNS